MLWIKSTAMKGQCSLVNAERAEAEGAVSWGGPMSLKGTAATLHTRMSLWKLLQAVVNCVQRITIQFYLMWSLSWPHKLQTHISKECFKWKKQKTKKENISPYLLEKLFEEKFLHCCKNNKYNDSGTILLINPIILLTAIWILK